MKTLNRPMFRYGGPIKEGVMSGIREPKRNGGSMMGNDEGPRRAALVGNPIYPKGPDGRTGHYVTTAIGLGLRGAAAGARYVPKIINKIRGTAKPKINTTPDMTGMLPGAAGIPNAAAGAAAPGFFKNLIMGDPLVRAGMYGYKALTGAGAKSLGQKAVRVALSPTTLASGVYFANGRYFNKKDEEVIIDEAGDVVNTITEKEEVIQKTPAEIKAAENKARMEKMDSYREIMDIKGMNKDAAYKSLIDASKIIQEGGNLKKSLKDGSLISKVTAAASKRFDKVSDTENALRSLVVKGEIDNELNKEAKALAGKSMAEIISTRMEKGDMFQGSELASLLRVKKGIDAKVLPSGKMEQGQDPLDYITQIVATTNADETTPDYPDGVYVIKDRIIQVLEGQVIPISVNQLA